MNSPTRVLGLVSLSACIGLTIQAGPVQAQQGYYNRLSSNARSAAPASSSSVERSREPINGDGVYRRAPIEQPEQPRATPSQTNRNYFPGMRVGQGPNRNYISPHTLCVPGRRAMLHR